VQLNLRYGTLLPRQYFDRLFTRRLWKMHGPPASWQQTGKAVSIRFYTNPIFSNLSLLKMKALSTVLQLSCLMYLVTASPHHLTDNYLSAYSISVTMTHFNAILLRNSVVLFAMIQISSLSSCYSCRLLAAGSILPRAKKQSKT